MIAELASWYAINAGFNQCDCARPGTQKCPMIEILTNFIFEFVLSEVWWDKGACVGALEPAFVWSHLPLSSWDRFLAALFHLNCPRASPHPSLTTLHDQCCRREGWGYAVWLSGQGQVCTGLPRAGSATAVRQALGSSLSPTQPDRDCIPAGNCCHLGPWEGEVDFMPPPT